MGRKILLGVIVLFLLIISGEVVYLLLIKPKTPQATIVQETAASTQPTASTSFTETSQDTLRVNKILGIYLSSASPLFANGEIKTTLKGYVVSTPQVDSDAITFQMNVTQGGSENSSIKAYFENTKFMNDSMQTLDYHSIKQGDQMSVVYIYNYKLDQYFTEIVVKTL